jgi:hypothetical protein
MILVFENREIFYDIESVDQSGDGCGVDDAQQVNEVLGFLSERDFEPVEFYASYAYDGDGFGNPHECCNRDF